jgi:hypothetical protein
MIFKSRKEILQMAKKYEEVDDEEAYREMDEFEVELLKKFDENDQEID